MKSKKIKKAVVKKVKNQNNIMSLAHVGTKEAVAKLEAYIAKEKNEDKKIMAELALDECRMFYYEPTNDQEENDYYLLKLIRQQDNRLGDYQARLSGLECEVKFAEQKLRVKKAMLKKYPEPTEGETEMALWLVQDDLNTAQRNLAELQDWLKDTEAFIETAKSLIVTERYKNIPEDYMDQVHFDNEALDDDDLFNDFEDGDCCCDDCCSEGDCGGCCPDCGGELEEADDL